MSTLTSLFLILPRPRRLTLTDTLLPDTTLFRSTSTMSASCRGAGSRSPRSRWRCSARRCGCIRDSRAGDRSETRLQKRLVEAELARLLERVGRSEEHTSELQSLMRISYAVFCLKKKYRRTHNLSTSHYRQT